MARRTRCDGRIKAALGNRADLYIGFFGGIQDCVAIPQVRRQRFFDQYMRAGLGSGPELHRDVPDGGCRQ